MVAGGIEEERQDARHDLSGHGGDGRAGNAHLGEGSKAEDQDGVEHDVDDRAHALGDHGIEGAPGGLQEPLHGDLNEDAHTAQGADAQVDGAVIHDLGIGALHGEEDPGGQGAQDGEDQAADDGQKDRVLGGPVGDVVVFLAQAAGEQGVDAHAGAHRHGDHQVLNGEGHGDGGEGLLIDPGDEHAVHHIVEGLDQHGQDHGQGHGKNELAHRHNAHFIFGHRRTSSKIGAAARGCGQSGTDLQILFYRDLEETSTMKREIC